MLRRTRWLVAVAATATALGAVPGGPASAEPGNAVPVGAAGAKVGGATHTITLLTGDVVTVRSSGPGCPQASVQPAKPDAVFHQSCGPDGHLHVIPASVASKVGAVLDPDLFDVTTLIAEGFDDESTPALPLIVQPAVQAARVAALADVQQLPLIGAVAGHVPKKSDATAKLATNSLLAGAKKVWLDRKVRATGLATSAAPIAAAPKAGKPGGSDLDWNLDQISAPDAWKSGYTGKGVRVAVLDTGADFTHPDLAGRVVDKADFTVEGGDAVDHNGHGTHTASTIAGTGAAAHGDRRGVAPDANLVIGKVLDDNGFGDDSQIIKAVEWAAERADVINMSLGGEAPDDGNDPLALAVDAASRKTGALFVVSSGNSGGPISAPGSASTALTVGAVDRNGKLAAFSSRGPLVDTSVAKPELVAPGVDIVAARAAGTNLQDPIDQYYEGSTGTSMAAPHVAGAAALLAQRHPDWKADRLKAALVGAADPMTGVDPYAVGAGRLNAERALSGPTSDQPTVDLGTFSYPQSGTETATLTWTGDSTPATVNLDLDVTAVNHDGTAAPRGAVTLTTSKVKVKRGSTASTTLRINRAALAASPGYYLATVTARVSGHEPVATTPVSFYVEPRSFDLTVNTKPMAGTAEGAENWAGVLVTNLDDPLISAGGAFIEQGESVTVRVAAGRYAITGGYSSYDPATDAQQGAYVGDTDVAINGDRSITLDPATARPVTAVVDGAPTTPLLASFIYQQTTKNGQSWWNSVTGLGGGAKVSVSPLREPSIGSLRAYSAFFLQSPKGTADPYAYDLAHEYTGGVPADPTYRVSKAEQAELARVDERFNQMDSPEMYTSLRRAMFAPDGVYLTQLRNFDLPANRTSYLSPGYFYMDEAVYGGLPAQEQARSYQPGSRDSKIWARQPLHSDWVDGIVNKGDALPCATAPSRTRGNLHLDLVMMTDQHGRSDCLQGGGIGLKRKMSLYRDGKLVEERDASRADFTVPQQAADYRVTFDLDTSLILPISTKVNTSWTFRSAGPSGTGSVPLPLLAVDYALPMDAGNHLVGGTGEFTVRQTQGVPAQKVTSFQVWTSTDDGKTWQVARATRHDDAYNVELPSPAAGQAVSLRVKADASGGSGIDQTIIRAYKAD
ncbi:S8 family serine peptidase [Micromonospora avicenniae]|uniref:Serine protease, subtilisin family n=1 Tax=Micromonospora avicenniae TaxID=1198245 RepID=A0A1N7DFM9_9ACTN|nr:S8 family serine peptidase [Micromonospora avicenniae]SIR74611.1 Serine protease, subtilisin family [Micromonospora avicenniae]